MTGPSSSPAPAAGGFATGGPLYWIGTAASVFLGAVYLLATWGKALTPDAFAEQIRLEGLDFLLPATVVVMIAFAVEGAVALALLTNLRRLWVLVPTTLLTLFFIGLNFRVWWETSRGLREESASCGCFGSLVERTPGEALAWDLVILGLPTVLIWLGRPRGRRFPPLRTALVALAAVAAPLLAWLSPGLPLDDLATKLSPGVEVSQLCAGRDAERVCLDLLVPELAVGEHLVVIGDLDDEAFTDEVDRLSDHAMAARAGEATELAVLADGTAEEHRAFFWQYAPAFSIHEVPEALLATLYRRLPRSFRVEDGTVTETWSGLPPLAGATGDGSQDPGT